MKCQNCNNDVQVTMKYCPYCSYDLTHQSLEFQKKDKQRNIIIASVTIIIVVVMIVIRILMEG